MKLLKQLALYLRTLDWQYSFEYDVVMSRSTASHSTSYIFKQWRSVGINFNKAWFDYTKIAYDGQYLQSVTILGIEFSKCSFYEHIYQFTPEEWASAKD